MRNIPLQIRDVLKEVSEELGIDYLIIEEVYYHQFEFLRDFMEHGKDYEYSSFENVLLKHLGTFYATERKINFLKEKGITKNDKYSREVEREG